ncbi:unnamed protein product [Paramecium sonneborni]|uniref:Uncharacterized protein n=1 Tax=Paramecium sonneborni TaxID=65129 RepID=A0A8S1NWG4_9CILI|nr:unnamed protein product [Paramecium sonneborni]
MTLTIQIFKHQNYVEDIEINIYIPLLFSIYENYFEVLAAYKNIRNVRLPYAEPFFFAQQC